MLIVFSSEEEITKFSRKSVLNYRQTQLSSHPVSVFELCKWS